MELLENAVFTCSTLPDKCFGVFQNMKQSGECCDVRINLENCAIVAHRVILQAVFPGLKSLLDNKNTGSNNVKEIYFEHTEPSALETLINFAYSCKLEIRNDNVEDLLSAALCLKSDEIVNACNDFLRRRLNVENVVQKMGFAENLHCTSLVETCLRFIRENFDEVSKTEGFLQLPLSRIEELISADDLKTLREENVFQAVKRWVEWSPLERKSDLPELLRHVRLAFIAPEYLKDCIATDEDIRMSLVCRDLLDDAKYYHMLPKRRSELCSLVTRPRKRMRVDSMENNTQGDCRIAGVYVVSKKVIYNMQRLNVETGEWEGPQSFTRFFHTYTATSFADTVYFSDMGGITSHNILSSSWDFNKNVCNVRMCATSVILQNKLYVCGGTDMKSCFNSVSCYDLQTKKCEIVPPMCSGRLLAGVVTFGECLYVFGGLDTAQTSQRSVEMYNPNSKTWTLLAPMSVDRYGMGCAALNGRIYVCGGKSLSFTRTVNSAEVYDPVKNKWNFITPMKSRRFNFSLVSDGRKLYAIGGCVGDQLLNSIEVYDPGTDVWESGPDIDPNQKYVQAFAVGYPV